MKVKATTAAKTTKAKTGNKMTHTQDYEFSILHQWFCDHVAFGRLDEVPDQLLEATIHCPLAYNIVGAVVLSAKDFAVPDDSIELMSRSTAAWVVPEILKNSKGELVPVLKEQHLALMACVNVVRCWCVLELLRRQKAVAFDQEVLIRELDNPNACRVTWLVSTQQTARLCLKWANALVPEMV